MYVKMMSGQNKADRDNDKLFRLISCTDVQMVFGPDGAHAALIDGNEYLMEGNVYILNDQGKTIDVFWPSGAANKNQGFASNAAAS